ncbi:ATPase domain-containing protein [Nocardioides sp. PD653]|nr:ATPase domain-containing protein [Nocardioides sp. PD653-B2]GAW55181.1 ATPase domain-containing protein [Nocardioides sp. PD653]
MSPLSSRTRSVRVRATAAATLVVAIFLGLGAVGFALLQRHQLENAVVDAARQQAHDLASQIASSTPSGALNTGEGDQSLVQIVDAQGRVIASSPSVDGEQPIVSAQPDVGTTQTLVTDSLPIGEGSNFVVVAQGARTPDGPVTILVAESLELVSESTAIVVGLLVVGYPLVLAAVGGTSYWLVGRALAPVEQLRRRVASIHGTSKATERVPVPDTHDEISRLAETMNAMLDRLHVASQSQRQFVADASHELRSPLATIRAVHEIAALHPEAQEWDQAGQEVLGELDRVDRLVADMLLLARADERGIPLTLEEVDLDDILRQEADRLGRVHSLDVALHAPPVRAVADRHQLARAVRNLTDNAARHCHSRIELRLTEADDSATIEVIDDGPGIPLADRDRVFERFVRLDQSRARTQGGTGLGLPIAREIAQSLGGTLDLIHSEAGARFAFTIPRATR